MVRGAGMTFKREGRSGILSVCIAVLAVIMVFGLSSFSEAVNATTSGAISARAVDETSIELSMPYTGDDNGNNTCTVQYKPCTIETYTAWITNTPHTGSPYKTTITGLAANTCYDIKTTYNDADNVGGAVTQTIRITSTWDNTLLHNVNRFPSSGKWTGDGGWGLPNTKYGKINCGTCHTPRASNIKGISGNITAPNGTEQFPGQTGGLGINFKSQTLPDGFGDDTGGHSASRKICEYCHSQTTYHRYNTTGQSYLTHNNNTDCLVCHPHAEGFYYATGACDSCHGNPPTADTFGGPGGLASSPKTGSTTAGGHSFHATSAGRNFACAVCHYNSVGSGATHRDGAISLGFVNLLGSGNSAGSYDGQTGANYESTVSGTSVTNGGTKTCSNIYCHGASMAPNGGSNTTPTWDSSGTGACGTCHGATAANPPLLGSHRTHTMNTEWSYAPNNVEPYNNYIYGRNLVCTVCHNNYTTNHVNGKADWSFDTATYPWLSGAQYKGSSTGTSSPVPGAYGQCSNLYCHSIIQTNTGGPLTGLPGEYKTPTWGNRTEGNCGTCHGVDAGHAYFAGLPDGTPEINTGSHTKHLNVIGLNAGLGGTPGGPGRCAVCHNYAGSDSLLGCSSLCHNRGDLHVNYQIDIRFAPKYGSSAVYNGNPVPGSGFAGCSNTYCHSNGTSVSTGTIPDNASPAWGSNSLACTSCHASPPAYANGSPKANSHPAHASLSCDKCHNATTTDGLTISNPANHGNKAYDLQPGSGISFTYTYSSSGGSCSSVSCHGYTNATWGVSDCLGCHSVSQGNRAAAASQFSANSHHVQGTVTGDKCYQCHWEANGDGTINHSYHGGAAAPGSVVDLVIYGNGARPTTYTAGSTAISYTANGSRTEMQKINSHCLGCHNDQNNSTQPFGDGNTPKQYAWDGTSVGARYSQTGPTSLTQWGKYSGGNITPKNTVIKAFSAHGNAVGNQGGWSTNETWPNTRNGSANVLCFDCHNSHGSTVSGTTTSYTSTTTSGGIFKDTTATKGGYPMTYQPVAGGSSSNKNAYSAGAGLCFDCHQTASAGTTPWGYSSTYGESQAITGYFDTPFFAPDSSGAQQRYAYKGQQSPKGGHFGASSPMSSIPSGTINGLCTPCHDPHGVSPTISSCSVSGYYTASECNLGGGVWTATPQYAVPLLKGTFLTSPYKEDVAPSNNVAGTVRREGVQYHIDQNTFGSAIGGTVTGVTQTDSQFAGLCIQCHRKPDLTDGANHIWKSKDRIHESVKGWKTADATIKHNYTCSKCHTPHNDSVLPRLMVTNCLNSSHKGRVNYNAASVTLGSGSGWGVYPDGNQGCYGLSTTLGGCSQNDYSNGGSGGGHIPGSWGGGIGGYSVACHETQTGDPSGTDQSWNVKTPWGGTFVAPVADHQPDAVCSNCSITLRWTPSASPDGNAPEFSIQVDEASDFSSPNYTSGWVSGMNWTVSLGTNTRWYWRVQERDSVSGTVSPWSNADSFILADGAAPPKPALTAPVNGYSAYTSCGSAYGMSLTWTALPVSLYSVQVSTDPSFATVSYSSGWLSSASWPVSVATNATYYWRVQAKNQVSGDAGPWSDVWYFSVSDTGCSGSCPMLYTWDGSQFAWEADLYPTGKLGLLTANGYAKPNADDIYLLVNQPVPGAGGNYELRMVEERSETDYMDKVKLYTVDMPSDRSVYAEIIPFTGSNADNPESVLHTVSRNLQRPVSIAHLNTGEDVAGVLAASDSDYLLLNNDNNNFSWQTLEIDFGDLSQAPMTKLIIDATSVFPSTPEGFALASQLSSSPDRTKLEVLDANVNWVVVPRSQVILSKPMEFRRPYVVNLSNIFLTNTYKIRLSFLYKTYVDSILFDTTTDEALSINEVPLASASLGYYGASTTTTTNQGDVNGFIYGVQMTRDYQYMPGNYTAYGDVKPLLTTMDDEFVIFRGGDEVQLKFNGPVAQPEGTSRRFLVYSHGYYKDFKQNSVIPKTVEPLPFAAMSNFPYDPAVESYPTDAGHNQYQTDYNTRTYP